MKRLQNEGGALAWWHDATPYQRLVLSVALLGWVFDSMNATIYTIVQTPALAELLGPTATKGEIGIYGGIIFSVFIIGWALGGIFFGIMADYFGRAKVMIITILIYAAFTGLAAISRTWWELGIYRFICGLGIGGEWAAGATLVAEAWPDKDRARAASVMQSAWAIGYFLAAFINFSIGVQSWRIIFLVGMTPALVALFIRLRVEEPECWEDVKEKRVEAQERGSPGSSLSHLKRFTFLQLFEPWIRRDTIVGTLLAMVAAFGLWGATNWTPSIIRDTLAPLSLSDYKVNDLVSIGVMSLNVGAFIGYLAFAPMADRLGRKGAFFIMLLGSALMLPFTFLASRNITFIILMLPLLGFFNNGIFSGFPIYFPELFPTYMRTTGSGFCFNAGRVLSAAGPFLTGYLIAMTGSYAKAASAIAFIYVLGLFALIFARETRGTTLQGAVSPVPHALGRTAQ
ncbi:MAG: MFS transporter [Candidatus Eremiobacteraeota bacterium]|nr:MFS transporter [Candidatus Eremiobacteraeota bacterium]